MNIPSPSQFTHDADLTIFMVLHLWLSPDLVYEDALEWMHSLALTLSDADYRYMEECFAQHIDAEHDGDYDEFGVNTKNTFNTAPINW